MFRIFTAGLIIVAIFVLAVSSAAHPAWGIVVNSQDQIYVSDLETIWKIDQQGRQSVFRAGVSGRHTHELTLDDGGNLYGEEVTYEPSTKRFITAIWKMTPAGESSYLLEPTGNPPKGLSIWRDRSGNTYSLQWTDDGKREVLLLKRAPNGEVSTLVGSRKSGGEFRQVVLSSIGGMSFGADGSLYLTDRKNIQKVTTEGTVTTIARNIAADNSLNRNGHNSDTSLSGITVDASGNVYAADFGNRRVLKITSDSAITTLLVAEGNWSPSGVAFKNGDLYILETASPPQPPRVRKLAPDGTVSTLAIIGENVAATSENKTASHAPTTANTTPSIATNIQTATPPKAFIPYLLIGLCAVVFAISFAVWRRRHKNTG